jgi:hypothetical protein
MINRCATVGSHTGCMNSSVLSLNYITFILFVVLYRCALFHSTVVTFQVFGGNMDRNTERHHYLNHPFTARYIRINPVTWHHAIALRAGLTGCPHTGDCGPGFVQVNLLSQCGKHCTVPGYLFIIILYIYCLSLLVDLLVYVLIIRLVSFKHWTLTCLLHTFYYFSS